MITNSIDYAAIYRLFDRVTPLPVDCGQLCGSACCRNSDPISESGMLLFPGEEAVTDGTGFRVINCIDTDNDMDHDDSQDTAISRRLLVCGVDCANGCPREVRPLACRIFPLFPRIDRDGRIRAAYDPRAWRICPLVQAQETVQLSPAFVRAVRRAGRLVARWEDGRKFLQQQTQEIDDFNRFLRLDEQRAPICRRASQRRFPK